MGFPTPSHRLTFEPAPTTNATRGVIAILLLPAATVVAGLPVVFGETPRRTGLALLPRVDVLRDGGPSDRDSSSVRWCVWPPSGKSRSPSLSAGEMLVGPP